MMKPMIILALALAAGCGPTNHDDEEVALATGQYEIKNGTPAVGYPELVKISTPISSGTAKSCSGVLLAPRLVMTAGHCLTGWYTALAITVTAPYVPASRRGIDTVVRGSSGNMWSNDVGYILLDAAIVLTKYPKIRAPKNGEYVRHFGRIQNGVEGADIYVSQYTKVKKPKFAFFFPVPGAEKFYTNPVILEGGDSGGPVMRVSDPEHTVVGVNSATIPLPGFVLVFPWYAGKNVATDLKGERPPTFGGLAGSTDTNTVGDDSGDLVECDDPALVDSCGDGVCQHIAGESCGTCATDCGCADGTHCDACMAPGHCVVNDPAQSCGAIGGTYCSQTSSCPSGYGSLGTTYDCARCCKPQAGLPSCGSMGGNYCSQTAACPSGYTSLGPSFDCNPCCKL